MESLQEGLRSAEEKVRRYLTQHGAELPSIRLAIDPELGEGALATHRYPATVVVRDASVPESVIAHELVHIAQGTLEHFRGFRLLYTFLAEGLAEWVAKTLYPDHELRYEAGYRLLERLVRANRAVVGDLVRVNDLPLVLEDFDAILASPHLPAYSRGLLRSMADRVRASICRAVEAGITDPTFVTLGEEVRAWKLLLDGRYEGAWNEMSGLIGEWFGGAALQEGTTDGR
jgi:hypothetical protein